MAVEKLYDALIVLDKWNVSGKHNQVSVDYSAEMLDSTVFGVGTRTNAPGLLSWAISGSGFWESAAAPNQLPDPNFFNRIGAAGAPLTVAPKHVDAGRAFFLKVVQGAYSFFGNLGELIPFSLDHAPTTYGCRGTIALPLVQKLAGGNGTALTLGTLGATQKLVAVIHVVQFSGTSLDVVIQSDEPGWASPTTRIAFTQVAGLTSEWKEALGPITPDTLFRASWSGTFTSFTALIAVGVV